MGGFKGAAGAASGASAPSQTSPFPVEDADTQVPDAPLLANGAGGKLLPIISQVGRVGAWCYDPIAERVVWDDVTRDIHEVAHDYEPSLDAAIAFYAPEARSVVTEAIELCLKTGEGWDLELPFVTATGRLRWVRAKGEALQWPSGDLPVIGGAFQDITDFQRERNELIEAVCERERAVNLLTAYQDALSEHAILAMTDRRGRIVSTNDKFCEVSGYTRSELMGQNHRILNSGHHPRSFFEGMWRTIASGRSWRGEICNRAKDGSLYWVNTMIVPVPGPDGRPIRYVSIRYDVTEQRTAKDKLLAQRNELDRARAELSQEVVRQRETAEALAVSRAEAEARAKEEAALSRILTAALSDVDLSSFLNLALKGLVADAPWPCFGVGGAVFLSDDEGLSGGMRVRASTPLSPGRERLCKRATFAQQLYAHAVAGGGVVYEPATSAVDGDGAGAAQDCAYYQVSLVDNRATLGALVMFVGGDHTPKDVEFAFLQRLAAVLVMGVTRRLQMRQVSQERKRLQQIVDSTGAGTWEWCIPTGVTHYSERAVEVMGMQPGEAPPGFLTWRRVCHPSDYGGFVDRLNQHVRGQTDHFEHAVRIKREDGSWGWAGLRGRVVERANDGSAYLFAGTISDITRRKTADDQLKAALEEVAEFFDVSVEMFTISHVTDGFLKTNRAFEEALGYRCEELAGQTLVDVVHPDDRNKTEAALARLIDQGSELQLENRCRHKNGDHLHFEWQGRRVGDRIFAAARDVTRRLQREEELRAHRSHAEAATRAKSQFLATMSHEIRTPMNGVLGMLELALASGELDADLDSKLTTARDSASALLTILNDVLDISKMEAGKLELEKVAFAPARVANDISELLKASASDKGLSLELNMAEAQDQWILGDPARVRQVLMNLVGNAIKFTSDGSVTISLDLQKVGPDTQMRFEIKDTGIGIPPGVQSKLFQRFSQADSSTNRRFGGTGLGLSICRQLVELMGGVIGVTSEQGAGSRFWFSIPVELIDAPEEDEEMDVGDTDRAANENIRPLRVLIAEDNPTNQQVIEAFVEAAGHEAYIVPDGVRVLEALDQNSFDVILMDGQMPEMGGEEATQHIRLRHGPERHIPIIAVTADAMAGDHKRFLAAGMNDYVCKPINPASLFAALARVSAGAYRPGAGDEARAI